MNHCPILLVEDNADDRELMLIAMRRAQFSNPVHTVTTGGEALAYLRGDGAFANRARHPLPFLVLLDLKLPEVSGLEVLRWIREELREPLIVIVLSSSAQPQDVLLAAQRHCNSYLVKPDSLQGLCELAQLIRTYWVDRNVSPQSLTWCAERPVT